MSNLIVKDDRYNQRENGTISTHLSQVGLSNKNARIREVSRQTEKSLKDMVRYFNHRKKKNRKEEAEFIMEGIYRKNYRGLI